FSTRSRRSARSASITSARSRSPTTRAFSQRSAARSIARSATRPKRSPSVSERSHFATRSSKWRSRSKRATHTPAHRDTLLRASASDRFPRRRRTLRSASVGHRPTLYGRVHSVPRQHRGYVHRERPLHRGSLPGSLLVPVLVSRIPVRALLHATPARGRGGTRKDRRRHPAGLSDRGGNRLCPGTARALSRRAGADGL